MPGIRQEFDAVLDSMQSYLAMERGSTELRGPRRPLLGEGYYENSYIRVALGCDPRRGAKACLQARTARLRRECALNFHATVSSSRLGEEMD